MAGRQDGQILPGLMILLLAIIGLGVLTFGVGRAALLRADAQTAADAAALAGARNIRAQLQAQVATRGYSDLASIDKTLVQAAAADYAERNGARLSRPVSVEGADVRVWVDTDEEVGEQGRDSGNEDREGEARARARLALALGAAGSGLGLPGDAGGPVEGLDCSKEELEIDTEGGARGIVDDAYRVAHCAGGEGVYVGSGYRPQSMTSSGNVSDHSRNDSTMAARDIGVRGIDLIVGPPSPRLNKGVVAIGKALGREYGSGAQRIVDTFGWKGYRLQIIWYTPEYGGHMGHIHIGARKGGVPIGGLGSGSPLFLGDAETVIKLVDWEAPAAPLFQLGGSPGGNPFGPPDPAVAAKLCDVLSETEAPPKARLALWEAAIVESGVHDLPGGDQSSVGVLQLLDIHYGGSVALRRDVRLVARAFLLRGFTGKGGAIAIARRNPGMSAGMVAQAVQGSDFPERYDQRREQAIAMNERFCGGKGL